MIISNFNKEEKKMNFKKNILIAGLVCAFGVAGAASFALSNPNNAEVVKADATTEVTTMYVEVCDEWYQGVDCVVEAYVRNTSTIWSWVDAANGNVMKLKDNLWQVKLPANTDTFIIVRKAASASHNGSWTDVYNQTANIDYNSQKNYYHVTGLNGNDCPYTTGWMNKLTGTKSFYVTVYNKDYDWFDESAVTTIRFWDGTEIKGFAFGTGSSTISFSSVGSNSTPIYAAGFNIFRKNSDQTVTWTQTGNWSFDYANKDMNAFVVETNNGTDASFYSGGNQTMDTDEYRAMAFGIHFLNKTNGICADNGADNNSSDLSGVWSNLSSVANILIGTDARKEAFKTGTEAFTANAFSRYAHIVTRYTSLTDFVGNVRASSNPLSVINANGNNVSIIVILISVLSLVAAGSFIVVRKKKESK